MQRVARVTGPAVVLLAAFAALLVGLAVAGGATPGIGLDSVAIVRDGIPAATLLLYLSIALALGALALSIFALSPREREFGRALDIAAAAAAVWTVASAASSILAFCRTTGVPPSLDQLFGQSLGTFLVTTDSGRAWLATTVVGAVLTVLCFAVRNVTLLAFVTGFAVVGVVPLSVLGDGGDGSSRNPVATTIWLHVVFASFWLGSLLTLLLLRRTLTPARMIAVLPRYAAIAPIAFVVVAASGAASAVIQFGDVTQLLTPHGVLVLAKAGVIVVLGLLIGYGRLTVIGRLTRDNPRKLFWILATAELAILGVAEGLGSALVVSTPPGTSSPGSGATPAEYLTGIPLPPELTAARVVTAANLDLLWALVCFFGIFFYAVGVWGLRRSGVRWPWHRSALWVAGVALLLWATNGSLNVYEQFLFSQHLIQQLLLLVAVPVLLVLGAPVTLVLDAILPREDGSRGAREWVAMLVRSRLVATVSHPVVAAGLAVVSVWVVTYSPLARWTTVDQLGHEGMIVILVVIGCLFAYALLRRETVSNRSTYPVRLAVLLAVLALDALFCWALSSNTGLVLADWYGAMGRDWGASPLMDQQTAGGTALLVAGIPLVCLVSVVSIRWRSRRRETTAA